MAGIFTYLYVLLATPWFLLHFIYDVVLCLLPWGRPTKDWSLNQAVRMRVVRLALTYMSLLRLGDRLGLKPGREGDRFEVIRSRSIKVYQGPLSDALIRPQLLGATWTPSKPPRPDAVGSVALHFHGGGFVIGDGRDHDTGFFAQSLIRNMGCTHVCAPQYRLASRKGGHFPAPLQDALTAYLHLLKEYNIPSSQIVFSGDSAGGNIALGLLRYIHEYGEQLNIPLPGAIALWSPWVDVGAALNAEITLSPYYATDYLTGEFGRWGAVSVSASGAIDPAGPYLAPLRHPFKTSADIPMFVHAGAGEVLVVDIREFCTKYKNIGWNLHSHESPACPHDILLLGSKLGFQKAGKAAAEDAGAFLTRASTLRLRSHSG